MVRSLADRTFQLRSQPSRSASVAEEAWLDPGAYANLKAKTAGTRWRQQKRQRFDYGPPMRRELVEKGFEKARARKQYCDEKKAIGANLRAHMSGREDRSFLAVQHVRPMRWWGWGFAAKNGSRGREVRSRRRDESGGPGVVPM